MTPHIYTDTEARAPFVGRRLADVIEEFDYYVYSLFRPAIKGGA